VFLKSTLKKLLFGSGSEPRAVELHRGLLSGLRYTIDPANSLQRLAGLDEREILAVVRAATAAARVAVDIGGAEGWYTLYFASQSQIEKVIVFEPQGQLRRRMKDNFALNDLGLFSKVDIRRELVGDRVADGWCRLDDALIGVRGPFMFKVDVDGGEADVLRGARAILQSETCYLVIETHSQELESACRIELARLNYLTKVIPNAWYRYFVPESRGIAHNRWLVAWKACESPIK
jgi:hypothetical protein